MTDARSPWWYRRRASVFTTIYVASFTIGGALWNVGGATYESVLHLLTRYTGEDPIARAALVALGPSLGLIGFATRLWGSSYLTASIVWNESARTDKLFVAGPFRFTRNPLYLGSLFIAAGFGVFATVPGIAFLLVWHVAFIEMLIRVEEKALQQRYGEAFAQYCKTVPRLIPRAWPTPEQPGAAPSFTAGLRAEVFSGFCVLAILSLYLHRPSGTFVFIAILVVGSIVQRAFTALARPVPVRRVRRPRHRRS